MKTLETKLFVAFLLLVIAEFYEADARVDVYKKSNFFNPRPVYDRHYSFENGRLLYARCDKNPHEYKCQVVLERSPFKNFTYSCNVTLELKEGTSWPLSRVFVIAFGDDKALLTWEDTGNKTFDKFITVHLPECRQSKQYDLRDTWAERGGDSNILSWTQYHRILTYKDTYDLFFKNYENCGFEKMCRLTVDAEGNRIQGPTPSMSDRPFLVTSIYSVAEYSSARGYFYMKYFRSSSIFTLIRPDGSEKQLTEFEGDGIYHRISTANGLVGICARLEFSPITQCVQFNLDGNVKLATNLTNDIRLQPVSMHNLPEGGFLLLFFEFGECIDNTCWSGPSGFSITQVNAVGKKVGDLRLEGVEEGGAGEIIYQIWEKENGEGYCVFFPSGDDLAVNCFTEHDFK